MTKQDLKSLLAAVATAASRKLKINYFPAMLYTGCPIDMLTTSDQILKIEKSHMPKSKPCFEILE